MKVIVTRENNKGTFDEVGMNNRMIIDWLKSESHIIKHAREFSNGKKVKLEYFHDDNVYGKPFKTKFHTFDTFVH